MKSSKHHRTRKVRSSFSGVSGRKWWQMEEEGGGAGGGGGRGVGGYSQFQSDSSGPATITSAVIMNTLFFFLLKNEKRRKKIPAMGVGLAFKRLVSAASSHLQQFHPQAVPIGGTNTDKTWGKFNSLQWHYYLKKNLKTSVCAYYFGFLKPVTPKATVETYSHILACALESIIQCQESYLSKNSF